MRSSKQTASDNKSMVDRIRAIQRRSPANKRCADCIELGPTYVCLDFHTFVCQYCSGIHREFDHKIKSISMSNWMPSEIQELEKGGNDCANATWLARWSKKEAAEPDSTDPQIVRDFLREKYVDKRWWKAQPEKAQTATDPPPAKAEVTVKTPEKVEKGKPMPMEDLLGDNLAASPMPSPALLPPAPVTAGVQAASLIAMSPGSLMEMSPAVATSSSSEWTADFSFGQPTAPAPAPPQQTGGLMDMQSAAPAPAPPQQTVGGLMDLDFSGASGSSSQSPAPALPPASGLLGVDFSSSSTATGSDAGAGLQGLTFPSSTPQEESSAGSETTGDRLRQALLSGKGNELNKLFDEIQKPEVEVSAADRFEALQGNLGNLFASPTQTPSPFAMPHMPSQPSMPLLSNMPALPYAPHQAPQSATPLSQTMASQQTSSPSLAIDLFAAPSSTPSTVAPATGAPTSEPFPQLSGPQHVGDQMAFMQGMIASALQAQAQTPGTKLPPSPTGNARVSSGPTSPTQPSFEEPPSPQKECEFGDLLAAFNERNPISGLA